MDREEEAGVGLPLLPQPKAGGKTKAWDTTCVGEDALTQHRLTEALEPRLWQQEKGIRVPAAPCPILSQMSESLACWESGT